jgi:hypothetical protein
MGATASNKQSKTTAADREQLNDYGPGNATTSNGGCDWTQVNELVLVETIAAVAACGDAISFARGRRGDWISVTILANGERPRWVAYDPVEMDKILLQLGDAARRRRG